MKVTINADGLLTISAETELEAYALRQWREASFTDPTNSQPSQFTGKLAVNTNLSADSPPAHYSGQSTATSAESRLSQEINFRMAFMSSFMLPLMAIEECFLEKAER